MALLQTSFFSRALQNRVSMNVILPSPYLEQDRGDTGQTPKAYPCLYLLHGLSDDHTFWLSRTLIELYTAQMGLIVVMPAVNRSFYCDMVNGYKYWTYLSEELPEVVSRFFHVSQKREDTFAAGFSMGGYGAFKLGLRCPERFGAVASISGGLDIAEYTDGSKDTEGNIDFDLIFGKGVDITGTDDDLLALVEKAAGQGVEKLPKFYQCCGTEDFLYEENTRFRDHARQLGLDLTYEESPGEHDWIYSNQQLPKVLEWLPIK
ncbi:MAG: esterase family protein [Planctomycetes bacterium]|nr:esterase family protein [Planctomycetota bacterium]